MRNKMIATIVGAGLIGSIVFLSMIKAMGVALFFILVAILGVLISYLVGFLACVILVLIFDGTRFARWITENILD